MTSVLIFDMLQPRGDFMEYTISFNEGRFRQLSSKYKLLICLNEENVNLAKMLNSKVRKQYEDSYAVYMDCENGTLVLIHSKLITLGAASTYNVEYAKVISFDTAKELLVYEIDRWNALIKRWESENDIGRVNFCKEQLSELEKILSTKATEWRNLLHK